MSLVENPARRAATVLSRIGASVLLWAVVAALWAGTATAQEPAGGSDMEFTDAEATTPAPAASASGSTTVGEPWMVAFAPRVGLIVPTSKLGVFVLGGLEIDAFLPVADHRLVVALDVSYTRPGMDGTVTDPGARVVSPAGYAVDVDQLKFALDFIFRFFTHDQPVIPYAGLGPVLHLLQSNEEADIGPGENSETSTEFGVELLAGVDIRLGPGFLLGELRFVYSGLPHELTGDSNAGSVTLGVGYRIGF